MDTGWFGKMPIDNNHNSLKYRVIPGNIILHNINYGGH